MAKTEAFNPAIRHILYLIIGVLFAFTLSQFELFSLFIENLREEVGYIDAFIGGFLFIYTFSLPVGALILISAHEYMPLWAVGVVGGLGSVLGDWLIFHFVRDGMASRIRPVCDGHPRGYFGRIFCSHYVRWTLPMIGAIIVALPVPDEIGVTLMGIAQMTTGRFLALAFTIDTIGIMAFVALAGLF